MADTRPAYYKFQLNDGTETEVTRNYLGLYLLRAYDQKLYEVSQMNHTDKVPDDMDTAAVIYAAYVSAQLLQDKKDSIMSFTDFLLLIPVDAAYINATMEHLFGINHPKANSPQPSEEKQE